MEGHYSQNIITVTKLTGARNSLWKREKHLLSSHMPVESRVATEDYIGMLTIGSFPELTGRPQDSQTLQTVFN